MQSALATNSSTLLTLPKKLTLSKMPSCRHLALILLISGPLPSNSRRNDRGRNFTIRNIAVSDSGQYYCEVDNGGDSVSSMTVQVTARSKSI